MPFDPRLVLVEDIHDAHAFIKWLDGADRPVLGVDTETTGLEWWTPHFTRTVQFGDEFTGWTLPLNWWYKVIQLHLENYAYPIVMHNAKFDIHALQVAGINVPSHLVDDTKIMSHILDPMGKHSLKPLGQKYVSSSAADGQSILKDAMRKNGWTWATIPFEFEGYWAYAALDTCITAKLHQILKDKMTKQETEVYEMELAVNHILREAETRGARVDLDYTRDLLQTWNFEMFNLRDEIKELGVENPNANKQIEVALKIEGWEPEEWTAKGNIKLDEGILKGLDFPIVQKILDYKKLKKWTKAYLSTFLDNADERGYLHADIHTLAAITGRMSITKPALQTLPRGPEIRNCIVASEGRHLLAIDYSQIEYRLFAHFSGEEKMITAMRNPATDFHSATAEIIFGPDYTSQQRSLSKNCNFAWLYGAGPARLAKTANKDEHVLTEDQARAILEQYRQTFPGAAQFMKEVERVAQERTNSEGRPYIYTPGGRKLFAEPDKNYTLVNFLCQGSAAEVLKNKIIELDNKGLTKYLILPIHDELLWDVPDEEWDTLVPQIKETMEDLTTFEVPLTVTVSEKLERWGDNAK